MSWGNGKHMRWQQRPRVCWGSLTHVSNVGRSDRDLLLAVSFFPQCKVSSKTRGTCQRTTSLALSLIRAVHEADMRPDSRLRQKNNAFRVLLNSWSSPLEMEKLQLGAWLAFLNLFLTRTSLSGRWTLWDIPYVRIEHPLHHPLTTTSGYYLSLKIFPLFFQLAGYQFFWGTWRRKSSPALSRLLSRMIPACDTQ